MKLGPTWLILITTTYFVLILNSPFWAFLSTRMEGGPSGSPLLTLQMGLFLFGLIVLTLSLVRLPYILKPAIGFLLIASAGAVYFMQQYGVVIDDDMLRNALQTDRAETAGLLSWALAGYILVLGVFPACLLAFVQLQWSRPIRSVMQTAGLWGIGLIIALLGVALDFKASAPFVRENGRNMKWRATPLNLVQSSVKVLRTQYRLAWPQPFVSIASRSTMLPGIQTKANNLVILVVGETARSMNFSLNGYARQTNPGLNALPVVSFPNVSSCGTSTAVSVPCMFSNLNREDYSDANVKNRENVLDLARRAGYRVLWLDNQAGSKGVADRVEYRQLERVTTEGPETPDADFIPAVQKLLQEPSGPLLLVLHQMGSHGPEYFKRSQPARKQFLPECQDKRFEQCTAQEITNAYDNTILETDHLLAGLIEASIKMGRQRPITLLYVGDHGESLGESGLYLHGMPYSLAPIEQTAVPMIYWRNARNEEESRLSGDCLAATKGISISHDNLFHITLGLLGVESDAYIRNLDTFARCRLSLESDKNAVQLDADVHGGSNPANQRRL